MFHRSLTSLYFIFALLLAVISPSASRPLSRRTTALTSASSSPQFVRRSHSNFGPSSHQRRSIEEQNADDDLLSMEPFYLDVDPSNIRRSLDTESDESQDDSLNSINQEKADADDDWEQFVATTPNEDPDSYPDSFSEDEESDPSCSDKKDLSHDASKPSSSLNDSGNKDAEAAKKKEDEAAKEKQAEAEKQKKAETDNEKKAEADKEKEAEADKEKKADADKEKKAEADKEKKAEQDKKQAAEAAQAKNDAEQQANAAKETKKKPADQPARTSDGNQVTDVQSIPGTPVTTGTVHKDHSADSYSSSSSEEHTGDATYYEPNLGACGITNQPTDLVVAVSHILYDSYPSQGGNPNTNTICQKMIRATYKGRSVDVKVVDRCEGCDEFSLDFTITAFEKLGSKDEGRLHGMTWTFI